MSNQYCKKQSKFALGIDWYLQTPPLSLSSLALPPLELGLAATVWRLA